MQSCKAGPGVAVRQPRRRFLLRRRSSNNTTTPTTMPSCLGGRARVFSREPYPPLMSSAMVTHQVRRSQAASPSPTPGGTLRPNPWTSPTRFRYRHSHERPRHRPPPAAGGIVVGGIDSIRSRPHGPVAGRRLLRVRQVWAGVESTGHDRHRAPEDRRRATPPRFRRPYARSRSSPGHLPKCERRIPPRQRQPSFCLEEDRHGMAAGVPSGNPGPWVTTRSLTGL